MNTRARRAAISIAAPLVLTGIETPDTFRMEWDLAPGSLFSLVATAAATPGSAAVDMGDLIAAHPLETLDGERLSVADLRGEIVVVNFWATWCKPCRRELPVLNELHDVLSMQGGRVVAISIDRDRAKVRRFLEDEALDLPVVHDTPDGLVKTLDLAQFPLTIVFDRAGKIVFTGAGAGKKTLVALENALDELLDSSPVRVAEGSAR